MNRSKLRIRFAGIVLLLGFSLACAESGAASETVATVSTPRERGHFLDVPALLENRAEAKTSPLLAGVKAPKLEPRTSLPGYHLSSANLVRNGDEPDGFLVIVNRDDGSFLALVNTSNRSGIVLGHADGTQTFDEQKKQDYLKDDMLLDPQEQVRADAQKEPLDNRNGETQITVLMGYSRAAADYVGDTTAHTLAQLETVNLGLRNSGVTGVRLVVGEIALTPTNHPVTGETLSSLASIFPNYSRSSLVAGFFMPTEQDTAVGWGSKPGRYTVNDVTDVKVFRHEVGHNASGSHCNEGQDGYAFGHSDGTYRTILCGNDLPYYSTPNRSINGAPLGNAKTADMARVWLQQASMMASYNGQSRAFQIQSLDNTSMCVDSHGLSGETKVGLWGCDKNNPNQQWVQVQAGNKVLIRLKANQTLCLAKGNDGLIRDVVLRMCHEGYAWEEIAAQFRTLGNQEYLYLNRTTTNTLKADADGSGMPGSRWRILNLTTP